MLSSINDSILINTHNTMGTFIKQNNNAPSSIEDRRYFTELTLYNSPYFKEKGWNLIQNPYLKEPNENLLNGLTIMDFLTILNNSKILPLQILALGNGEFSMSELAREITQPEDPSIPADKKVSDFNARLNSLLI